jgi:hypothetical protein
LLGVTSSRTPDHAYVVQLLITRSTTQWDARLSAHPGRPGEWSWAPLDSTHFSVNWGGVDGAVTYVIERHGTRLVGREVFFSGNTKTETTVPVSVRRVNCAVLTG